MQTFALAGLQGCAREPYIQDVPAAGIPTAQHPV